uniref:Uncharacterized protein n=1 Tax=Chromera velia CCMP2878 TaxID=1169474 RepID=A0A0G4I1X5_9ALVE|mmetsp:Transcript_25610/g.50093  ORF Transcript_25610/g.50093 Transcript_25610/m.50093 type:complete len:561 (-) Transcript_25610:314-1996(-)|eukprot:Cvel_10254.t1-p1 / transcript=Cvel_10254.t1 / gene=Cvel_10254 / organism=Chromera_velia_CCMP2878 / gene_product=hypothetical protein / transcript_product=hypothetical protein / location=Cvel_scaffold614:67465-70243(+) / protein_length=560 / sequence_SO=supercontig / SO=protein_coding / is_pseudo=false
MKGGGKKAIQAVHSVLCGKPADQYEREPVPPSAFKSWWSFAALFSSRHIAAPEFTIGPLFIIHGASALDAFIGLMVGSILATLSWRFLCAPVAVKKRLTLYYTLERIAGRRFLWAYNVVSAIAFAVIAGAMFSVSASAVGALLQVPMPGLNDVLPSTWEWVVTCAVVGAVTSLVAAFGYGIVSLFAMVVTPYIYVVVALAGVNVIRLLSIDSAAEFWDVASRVVWTGTNTEGFAKFGLAHCICFAWFADLFLHVGQGDLSVLRFAKDANASWTSSLGMILGHYVTWLIAGMMYAVQVQSDPENTGIAAGPMAERVVGIPGLVLILFAGWSTANPLLYAAGLAVQSLFPKTPTWAVTLGVGGIATVAGLFPGLLSRLLSVFAFFGLILMPVGVAIFCDTFVLPRMRLDEEYSAQRDGKHNLAMSVTWGITNLILVPLVAANVLEVFFAPFPSAALSAGLYIGLSRYLQRREGQKNEAKELEEGGELNKGKDAAGEGETVVVGGGDGGRASIEQMGRLPTGLLNSDASLPLQLESEESGGQAAAEKSEEEEKRALEGEAVPV